MTLGLAIGTREVSSADTNLKPRISKQTTAKPHASELHCGHWQDWSNPAFCTNHPHRLFFWRMEGFVVLISLPCPMGMQGFRASSGRSHWRDSSRPLGPLDPLGLLVPLGPSGHIRTQYARSGQKAGKVVFVNWGWIYCVVDRWVMTSVCMICTNKLFVDGWAQLQCRGPS
jgi:hypothetical protein